MKAKRLVVISDLHCGSNVGLTPPSWHDSPPADAPRGVQKRAEFRRKQWRFFADTVKALQPVDRLIVLGDCIDGAQPKAGGVELIARDRNEQVRMAVDCIQEVKAKRVAFVYGTGYHVGAEEDFEDQVAEPFGGEIAAQQDIDINGVIFNAKHYAGNTASPPSRFTFLSAEQVRQLLWASHEQQPKADVILRGHAHRYAVCGEEGWMAFLCPPLQGLGGKIARMRSSLPLAYGLLSFDVLRKGGYAWNAHVQPLSAQAARVLLW